MSYRLYYSPGACSLAVHIVLEEIGVPFERHEVSVTRGENHAAAFVGINPKARVPALEVAGETRALTELPAIVTFLAQQHPQARLLPASSALEEARCHEWLAWLVGWVHGAGYGALWRPARFAANTALHEAISAHGRQTIIESYVSIEAKLAD